MAWRKSASIIALLWMEIFLAQNCLSNGNPPEESSVDHFLGLGARAMGMGGAHIAVAEDFSALWWNPAGLARIRRIELSGGLIHQREKSSSLLLGRREKGVDSHTRLGSGGIAVPIPTYRGSLVFGFGFNRIKGFDSLLKFKGKVEGGNFWQEGLEERTGGLHAWGLGGAIDLSPILSLGVTAMVWGGGENYTWHLTRDTTDVRGSPCQVTYQDYDQDDYSGINLKFGLLLRANRFLTFGGTLESPLRLTIEQDWRSQTDSLFGDSTLVANDNGYYKYRLSLPYRFGLGARLTLPYLILAAGLNYTDWSEVEYRYPPEDVSSFNPYMGEAYRDVLSWHLGVETLVPKVGVKLRFGYYQDPLPYRLKQIKDDRSYLTLGLGFLLSKVMTIDVALIHGTWETSSEGLDEGYTINRSFLTAAYRF